MKVVHIDHGLVPLILRNYQKKMFDSFWKERYSICKLPRQSGKTTTVVAYILWYILFHSNVRVALLAHRADTARELFQKLRLAYEHLPKFLQAGIAPGGWNKGSIILGNGSSAKADSTSGGSIRGETFNLIVLDEFAFVETNLAESFLNSVYPTISSGATSKMIVVSTPKGMNHFYEMWDDAKTGKSKFNPVEINWDDVPGRDEAWKKEQISNIGLRSWNQEFEAQFIGSSDTLISGEKLMELKENWEDPIHESEGFSIYEDPKVGHQYSITVDVSRGQGLDYQAFSVVDVTNLPYKQVCVFRDNELSPTLYPSVIHNAARRYNDAHILVEVNDIGQQIADMLIGDLDTENVIRIYAKPGVGQTIGFGSQGKTNNGLKMSPATKRIGCADLKTLIESDKLIVKDKTTIREFMTFVADVNSFSAEEGYHDDAVMTLVLFGWLSHQRYFREETKDIRASLEEAQQEYLDRQMVPFGVFDDGTDGFSFDYEENRPENYQSGGFGLW